MDNYTLATDIVNQIDYTFHDKLFRSEAIGIVKSILDEYVEDQPEYDMDFVLDAGKKRKKKYG